MLKHETKIRVRYADTDKMQFVYNGKYLEYFEVGRTELLRGYGSAYSEVEKMGYQLPLIEAGVRYKNPAHYDDLLKVTAIVKDIFSARLRIDYVIEREETNDLIAEGFTEHIFIREESKKPVRPPKFYIETLKPYIKVPK
ncbi:MAG: thioesterase family protein [Melioribacteraceae bacterium]|nr:thioesterase family protein [Melioribacteraceae bacterium]